MKRRADIVELLCTALVLARGRPIAKQERKLLMREAGRLLQAVEALQAEIAAQGRPTAPLEAPPWAPKDFAVEDQWVVDTAGNRAGKVRQVVRTESSCTYYVQYGPDGPFDWLPHADMEPAGEDVIAMMEGRKL